MNSRPARILGNTALSLAAAVGLVCVLMLIGSVAFGLKAIIFRSGSMSPTIETGALGVAHKTSAADLAVGDIVMVPYNDSFVTHRIVKIRQHGDSATLRLKGDANEVRDPLRYDVTSAQRIVFHVPWVGAVIAWLSRAPGIFVLAAYAAVLMMLIMRRRDASSPRDDETRTQRGKRRGASTAAATIALMVATTAPAWAKFTDAVPVNGTNLATWGVLPPTAPATCGTSGILAPSVVITWTAPATGPAVNYQITVTEVGETIPASTKFQSTTSITLTAGLLSTIGGENYVAVVKSYPVGAPTWLSGGSVYANIHTNALGLGMGCNHI